MIEYWFRKGKGMWLKNKLQQNQITTKQNLIVWWNVTLLSMGRKKKLHSSFSQRKQSTGRKVIMHYRTGKIHPWSELPELFLSLQMDFIKPSIPFFQTCLHFSLPQMMQEKLIFYSFQNKHYSTASAVQRVMRFSVCCVGGLNINSVSIFTDGWLNAQRLLIGKYP